MVRRCSSCGTALDSFATRCTCGAVPPDAQGLPSDPERPHCAVCKAALELMAETCPACGARGFPALRPRRGRTSAGPPPAAS